MTFTQTFFSRQFRWEIVRILTVGAASLLFYFELIPLPVLLAAMAFGLFSLVKIAATDLVKERKIGTELFITVAVIVSVLGKEYLAGAVVLMIILIAEYVARCRSTCSIKKVCSLRAPLVNGLQWRPLGRRAQAAGDNLIHIAKRHHRSFPTVAHPNHCS